MDLAQYLETQDISQRKFSIRIGMTPAQFCRIVGKLSVPTLETASKIVHETYGKVTYEDLLRPLSNTESKKKQRGRPKNRKDKLKLGVAKKAVP